MEWIRKDNIEKVKGIYECSSCDYTIRITELRLGQCIVTIRYMNQTIFTASEIYDDLKKAKEEAQDVLVSFANSMRTSVNSILEKIDPFNHISMEVYAKFFESLGWENEDGSYFFKKGTNMLWVYTSWNEDYMFNSRVGLICMCPKSVFDRQSNSRHINIKVYEEADEPFPKERLCLDIEKGEWLCKHVKNDLFNKFIEIDI